MTDLENGLTFSPELQTFLSRLASPVVVVRADRTVLWQNRAMSAYRHGTPPAGRSDSLCRVLGCSCRVEADRNDGAGDERCRRCGLRILIANTLRLQQRCADACFHLPLTKKRSRRLELSAGCVIHQGLPAALLTFRDESEQQSRKHLLAEIKRLTDALHSAGSVCHELAQPLMTISGYVQLLLMDTEKGSTRYTRLEKINDQALRISAIARQIMNIRQRHLAAEDQHPSSGSRHRHLTLL